MLKLAVKLALAAAAFAALFAFVPFGGRTLSDRWRAAPDPEAFLRRTWAEMQGAPAPSEAPRAARPPPPGRREARREQPAPAKPVDQVTESERRALERRLAEELGER
jgi:hypothetical protein